MEKSRNTGFCGGGEDEERHSNGSSNIDRFLQDPVPSIGIQNILGNNQIQTAVEAKSMKQPEPGQRQQADISTADSHSGRNILQITEAEKLERKRKSDQKYRNKVKEDQKRLKSTAETLEAENERLKQENVLVKQQLEAKSKEFDLLKKNYDQQCENEQRMESLKADNECLKEKLDDLKNKLYELNLKKFDEEQRMNSLLDENGLLNTKKSSLEVENASVKQRFQAKSKKLVELGNDFDKLKQKYNKLRGKKRGLKADLKTLKEDLKTLKEENGLKSAIIKSLNASLEEMSKYSGELVQLRSKLANLELASTTSCTKSQSMVRRSTNFIGGFGQYGHNWERTKGIGQLSQSQPARFPVAQAVQLQVDLDKELGNSIKLMIV